MEGIGTLDMEMSEPIPFYALISTILDADLIHEIVHIDPSKVYCVKEDGTAYRMPEIDMKGKTDHKPKKSSKSKSKNTKTKSKKSEPAVKQENPDPKQATVGISLENIICYMKL